MSESMNERIRRNLGRPQPPREPEDEREKIDYGAGVRPGVVSRDPHEAMNKWVRERAQQLVTRGQTIVVPTRRKP